MDSIISEKIFAAWGVSPETVKRYVSFYSDTLRPAIKTRYLSHLVATVEDMVNEKKKTTVLAAEREQLKKLLVNTNRLYSIVIVPKVLKKRATTRYHKWGAIIYYNSIYDEKTIRILIAHELGHIVNKELLENTEDSEQAANLFAYIAMDDKNRFYTEECKKFVSHSDIQILNDIINNCPVS